MMINVHRLVPFTYAEGPGKRVCVWFQGCSHHCSGCFAKDTWGFETKSLYSSDEITKLFDKDPQLEGIKLLGGEPFDQPDALLKLLQAVKAKKKSTVVFTGYTYEFLKDNNNIFKEILTHIDVLIDGEYKQELRSFDVPLIGSTNQRYWFLTNRYCMKDFPKNRIEAIIEKNGVIKFNGMGDFPALEKQLRRQLHEL